MKKIMKLLLSKNVYIISVVIIYLFFAFFIYFFDDSLMGLWILSNIQKINSAILLFLFILMIVNFINFIKKTDAYVYKKNQDDKTEKKELMFAMVRNMLCLVPLILIKLFVKLFQNNILFSRANNFEYLSIVIISFLLLSTIIIIFGTLLFKFRSNQNNNLSVNFKVLIIFFAEMKKKEKSKEKKNNKADSNLSQVLVNVILHINNTTVELFWKIKRIVLLKTNKKYNLPAKFQV
ncbi:hypothetical protein EELLY_v1c00580 [Entomoplasma ellychniae]|uniref:Transmembrane protein n=1 Tax=Entomoplasma ellychniae TaxID=2114 RepID=A0A8E2UDS3_9MOLU|nr:hypothetical protein [Entomoplasma ellychniae]PPE04383.1 hypothetical protein EELLY_v1c00580 [Entomoplasma ellychniae]